MRNVVLDPVQTSKEEGCKDCTPHLCKFLIQNIPKMTGPHSQKCSYNNSGYCKFSRSKTGCKRYHPTEICQINSCASKTCPQRHPKTCKYGENCMYQAKCSYRHNDKYEKKMIDLTQMSELEKQVDILTTEINVLKKENDEKINTLAKAHLKELEDIKN